MNKTLLEITSDLIFGTFPGVFMQVYLFPVFLGRYLIIKVF